MHEIWEHSQELKIHVLARSFSLLVYVVPWTVQEFLLLF